MRTTLTLADDVADALKERALRTRQSFKQVVNDTLRAGLRARKASRTGRYGLKPCSLGGVRPGLNLDKALSLADTLEDAVLAHKLELRK